jgi:hypothetical protein
MGRGRLREHRCEGGAQLPANSFLGNVLGVPAATFKVSTDPARRARPGDCGFDSLDDRSKMNVYKSAAGSNAAISAERASCSSG